MLNCPWSAQKVNARLIGMLREVVRRSKKPLCFRIFVGTSLMRHAAYLPFVRELEKQLAPAKVESLPKLSYAAYMAVMEEGDLSIDAFHYGGCNTMTDSLYLGKPMASLEGERWYNRIGPQMLRMVGEDGLIATTEREYVDLILRLIRDDALREASAERLRKADLNATIFNRSDAKYFRKAIDYLIANHEALVEGERADAYSHRAGLVHGTPASSATFASRIGTMEFSADYSYAIYGLRLDASRPIPGVPPAPAGAPADLVVSLEGIPAWLDIPAESMEQPWYVSSPQGESDLPNLTLWRLQGGEYIRFLYQDGIQFVVDRAGSKIWASGPRP